MAVSVNVLWDNVQVAASYGTLYTAPANTQVEISAMLFHNTNATAEALEIRVVPSGGAGADSNKLFEKILAADETWEPPGLIGHVLDPGDFISAQTTTAAKVSTRATGRLYT